MPSIGPPLGVRLPIGPFDEAPAHLGLLLADHLHGISDVDAVRYRARVQWLVENLETADVAVGCWDRRVIELVASLGPGASQSFIGLVMRAWPGAAMGRVPSAGRHATE